jgi:hypothetical protein
MAAVGIMACQLQRFRGQLMAKYCYLLPIPGMYQQWQQLDHRRQQFHYGVAEWWYVAAGLTASQVQSTNSGCS